MSLAKRFQRKVSRYPTESGCLEWTAATNGRYGIIRSSEQPYPWILAHRVAYELHYGPIDKGLVVLHRCDNPMCVNHEHLFVGTHKENSADMVAKGRARKSVFGEEDVANMRKMRSAGLTQREIGLNYGVSGPLVSLLLAGKVALRIS